MKNTHIYVLTRVRPRNDNEAKGRDIISATENKVAIFDPKANTKTEYSFDRVFGSDSTQDSIFNDIGDKVIHNVFKGFNTCIFAYGQTGSGKTYTMMGVPGSVGVIPRILEQLFTRQSTHDGIDSKDCSISYDLSISYFEIYAENAYDLLCPPAYAHRALKVKQLNETVTIDDLVRVPVDSANKILHLLAKGNSVRSTAATAMNDRSSRSHAILTVYFTKIIKEPGLGQPRRITSKLNLVDLAGSERIEKSQVTGVHAAEAIAINKSLLNLGIVIAKLCEQSKSKMVKKAAPIIPYRESMLTWVLKDSIGGNSITCLIANISPSSLNHGETIATLRFAAMAGSITYNVSANEDPNDKNIKIMQEKLARLQKQIDDGTATKEAQVDAKYIENILKDTNHSWEQKFTQKNKEYIDTLAKKDEVIAQKEQERLDALARKDQEMQETIKRKETDLKDQQREFERGAIVDATMELQKRYDQRLNEEIARIRSQTDADKISSKTEIEKYSTRIKELEEKLSSTSKFANDLVMNTKTQSLNEIEKIKNEYEKRIDALRVEYDEKFVVAQEKNTTALSDKLKELGDLDQKYRQMDTNLHMKISAFADENTYLKKQLKALKFKESDELRQTKESLQTLQTEYKDLQLTLAQQPTTQTVDVDELRIFQKKIKETADMIKTKLDNLSLDSMMSIKDDIEVILAHCDAYTAKK